MEAQHIVSIMGAIVALSVFIPLIIGYLLD